LEQVPILAVGKNASTGAAKQLVMGDVESEIDKDLD